MILSIIVAMTENRVIGKDNRLPWHLSPDLKRFKQLTMGHPIIMGRKTFDSIGRPLPGRTNIVLTRDPNFQREGITVVNSFEKALRTSEEAEPAQAFVIGGGEVFRLAFPLISRLYLTLIHEPFEGDAFFPEIDLKKDFHITENTLHVGPNNGVRSYSFITATKKV